ncbi:MAG TPA: cupin domain-containing protein [Stellaceae bacterium]|jgi:quercetin dioxygenase-like cupin family protein|nr:cupin domain-containing protein [Stellaceae bacterium]
MSGVRRIVTGHRGDGLAIIKSDSIVEPQPVPSGDAAFAKLWVTQTSPADNTDERDGAALASGLTCMDGTVLRVVDFQPGKVSPMHKTNSVDYGIVLFGDMEMRLDSGEATRLKPGDIVVQRGTNHAWANVGTGVARMAFVLIDAWPLGEGTGVTP